MNTADIRILVVDDDEDVLNGTAHLLERAGYITSKAQNSVEALRAMQTFHPHLVLSDRDMPEMDGMELCRRIKLDLAWTGVFFVLISGTYTQSAEQSEGLESGADGYITRPITNRELLARVDAYVRIIRLQIHLTQARKMETVGLLAGGVAHNFNNLLMGIMGYAELGRECLPPNHPIRPFLDEITKAAERSAELTRLLLAFSSKQIIVPKVLDLNETVADTLTLLHSLIGENIDVAWIPGRELWPVKLDTSQVNQILTNLCTNARDANAGKVVVTTANAVIDQHFRSRYMDVVPGEYVQLAVKDDGRGMDSQTLDKLFEPFFTTKDLSAGAGLGLASVHGILRQNHGFIQVESGVGRGTTFKIYFPRVAVVPELPPLANDTVKLSDGPKTVLLVDDEKGVLDTVCKSLESFGCTVLVAGSATQGLRLAEDHSGPIDLLLTDVLMPGMNGRQLAENLQASRPDIKCIFMSGYTADELIFQGNMAEGVNFLSKPFVRDQLAHKVREVMDEVEV